MSIENQVQKYFICGICAGTPEGAPSRDTEEMKKHVNEAHPKMAQETWHCKNRVQHDIILPESVWEEAKNKKEALVN